MKHKKVIIAILVLIILGSISSRGKSSNPEETTQSTTVEASTAQSQNVAPETSEASSQTESQDIPDSLKDLIFFGSVRGDVTGNWRYSMISSSVPVTEYAANYYTTYFESDDEIHFIVNTSLNTTSRISKLMATVLDVTILERVDGEEHSADSMGSGDVLGEYWIHLDTGEIEEIS